jgi:hypothetical protein
MRWPDGIVDRTSHLLTLEVKGDAVAWETPALPPIPSGSRFPDLTQQDRPGGLSYAASVSLKL